MAITTSEQAAVTTPTKSRFDYVKYDDVAAGKQARLKVAAQRVEAALYALDQAADEFDKAMTEELMDEYGQFTREDDQRADDCDAPAENAVDIARQELVECLPHTGAFQRLEQAYMWCGKAIRDDQIRRNGSAPLQEERTNG